MPSTAVSTRAKKPVRRKFTSPVIHVVAGLIRHPKKKHKILFTRRKPGQHLENLWEFPGGKLELGESRFQGLKRELDEELGIEVLSAQPLHAVTHKYPDKNIHLDVWEVLQYKGKPHGREGQESIWLKPNQVADYPFPEADEPVLKALQLPRHILITPELAAKQQQDILLHFSQLMKQRRYPRVLLRSHQMNDKDYHLLASKMQEIALLYGGEIIIHRPKLNGLQQKRFAAFHRRHLSASNLSLVDENSFEPSIVLSASCHDAAELEQAQQSGCEFALLSSVRETQSHPGFSGRGWSGFYRLSRDTRLPLYALGGIERKDFVLARYQGAIGVAGIGDFWSL